MITKMATSPSPPPPPSSSSTPYPPGETHIVSARSSVAVPLSPNQTIRIINTHGTQVVDTWAFALPSSPAEVVSSDLNHHMSMSHTRACNNRFSPMVNDVLYTNHRLPILKLVEDTSPGVHDTVVAACDIWRYRELAGKEMDGSDGYHHESCAQNLSIALKRDVGIGAEELGGWGNGPDPLNLFMNIPIHTKTAKSGIPAEVSPSAGAELSFEKPVCKEGDFVRLRNVSGGEVVVVMSACPQDLLEINCRTPRSVEFVVEEDE